MYHYVLQHKDYDNNHTFPIIRHIHCGSSNARKLILSYGSIYNGNLGHELGQSYVELTHELGQSDVELGQSDVNPNIADEPPNELLDELLGINLNEPSVETPLDEHPDEPPDEPLDDPLGINLVFCFDPNPYVASFSFYLDTNTYLTANLDNLGPGDTYENLGNNPGNGLGSAAPFKLNAGPGAELDVGVTVSGIGDERGTDSTDLEVDENPDRII